MIIPQRPGNKLQKARFPFILALTSLICIANVGGGNAQTESAGMPSNAAFETAITYGQSRKGRPFVAYLLGDGTNITMVSGGVHGNEPSAPGLVLILKRYLEAHPEELSGCRVILVPHVNPDGDAAGTRANAAGVDLNRNFPVAGALSDGVSA